MTSSMERPVNSFIPLNSSQKAYPLTSMQGMLITGRLHPIICPTSSLNAILLILGSVVTIIRDKMKFKTALTAKDRPISQVHFTRSRSKLSFVSSSINF